MIHSRWFHVAEFDCHDGTPYPEAWEDRLERLCYVLDAIRSAWGGPLRVVSGYRTPAWNQRIDGAQASQHVEGLAADIAPMVKPAMMQLSINDLHGRILRLNADSKIPLMGGLGYYAGKWIHVDVRARPANGHLAQWHGQGVGAEQA